MCSMVFHGEITRFPKSNPTKASFSIGKNTLFPWENHGFHRAGGAETFVEVMVCGRPCEVVRQPGVASVGSTR